jgi:hypothetical protein
MTVTEDKKAAAQDETGEHATRSRPFDVAAARQTAAKVVGWVCLAFALFLVAGALFIALGGNNHNDLVHFVKHTADKVDLGVFDRKNGVFDFETKKGKPEVVKNVLVNWGLAAVAWLAIGKVASAILRK